MAEASLSLYFRGWSENPDEMRGCLPLAGQKSVRVSLISLKGAVNLADSRYCFKWYNMISLEEVASLK
jgi:hypothetical protein